MPAAAVIPAPIAYIKVVAVKKLVVGFQFWTGGSPPGARRHAPNSRNTARWLARGALHRVSRVAGRVYFEKIRVLKAGYTDGLNAYAWNNGIGPRFYFVGFLNPR